jgi:hypothetical protein
MLKSGEEDICYQIIEKIENNDVALFDFTPGQNYFNLRIWI